jgi:hypothetical protein
MHRAIGDNPTFQKMVQNSKSITKIEFLTMLTDNVNKLIDEKERKAIEKLIYNLVKTTKTLII